MCFYSCIISSPPCERRFWFGWSLTTVSHPARRCIPRVIKYCCCRGGWRPRLGQGPCFLPKVWQVAAYLKGGDVTKGQVCRFLQELGGNPGENSLNQMCILKGNKMQRPDRVWLRQVLNSSLQNLASPRVIQTTYYGASE